MKPNATVVVQFFFSLFSHEFIPIVERSRNAIAGNFVASIACYRSLVLDRSLDSGFGFTPAIENPPTFEAVNRPRRVWPQEKGRTRNDSNYLRLLNVRPRALSSVSQVLIEIKSGRMESF